MMHATDRELMVICTALAHAAAAIAHLPEAYQNLSDREDMLALLRAAQPKAFSFFVNEAAERMAHLEDQYHELHKED
jgi:hypothetical protein